jgi:cell wall assembly regulator SMI1
MSNNTPTIEQVLTRLAEHPPRIATLTGGLKSAQLRTQSKAAVNAIAAPRLRLLDFCKAQNLLCLDLLPGLQAQADQRIYYTNDSHLNAQGNRAAATLISTFLR